MQKQIVDARERRPILNAEYVDEEQTLDAETQYREWKYRSAGLFKNRVPRLDAEHHGRADVLRIVVVEKGGRQRAAQ